MAISSYQTLDLFRWLRKQPEEYATIRLINANTEQLENDRAEELDIGKNECAATVYAKAQVEKDAVS